MLKRMLVQTLILVSSPRRLATFVRLQLQQIALRRGWRQIPAGAKLHVGCGDQYLEGYIGCDLRALPTVGLVCKAWEVSRSCRQLSEIFSRHMLEHLTWEEAELTLRDWHQSLAEGGCVHIIVPNLDFAIAQWQRAEWTDEAWEQRFSDARWGFANFFGWQRECDPLAADYSGTYWDVHKSGYNHKVITYLLQRAGFTEIDISYDGFTDEQMQRRGLPAGASDGCHLIAKATKCEALAEAKVTCRAA